MKGFVAIVAAALAVTLALCVQGGASTTGVAGASPYVANSVANSVATRSLTGPGSTQPAAVPSEYQSDYDGLQAVISSIPSYDDGGSVLPDTGGTTLAAELETADGDYGTALLKSGYLSTVTGELSDFVAMGVSAVEVSVSFPLLLPSFTDSSQYLSFYEQVAAAAQADGLQLYVEENPIIPDLSNVSVSDFYSSLTVQSYAADQQQQAQIIINDLHPQYLDLLDEVSTFTSSLGLAFDSTSGVTDLLDAELDGLPVGSTQIGAGIGTWESTSLEQAIASVPGIDYLSVHFYPTSSTGQSQLATLDQVTTIAATAGLPLHLDETGDNKSTGTGPPTSNAADEQKLKSFSFWEPLDEQYLTNIVTYARDHGISYVSPFDTNYFFDYLTWTSALDADSDSTVTVMHIQATATAIQAGQLTGTGETYLQLAGGTGGTDAPGSGGPGYWMLSASGTVYSFGSAAAGGSATGGTSPAVGIASTPGVGGYWVADANGTVRAFGDAASLTPGAVTSGSVVAIAATPDGGGYWLATSTGQVVTAGDAVSYGSLTEAALNAPVVSMAATPGGGGYWLLGADGGVFTFGDAGYYGSTGGLHLNEPAVAMTPTADGKGYWFVASDGGVFTFGDASYYGSTYQLNPNLPPGGSNSVAPVNKPVNGIVVTADGKGYWFVASDGGVFTFGDAGFVGSLGNNPPPSPIVGFAAAPASSSGGTGGTSGGNSTPACTAPGSAPDSQVADPTAPHGIFVVDPGDGSTAAAALQYLLPNPDICGADLFVNWSTVDSGPGADPRYDWSSVTSAMQPWVGAGKTVNLIVWGASEGAGAQTSTPAWVQNQVQMISCGGDEPPTPVFWQSGYEDNWQAFITAFLGEFGSNPNVGYIRFGLGTGGEALVSDEIKQSSCAQLWDAAGYPGDYETYTQQMISYMGSLHSSVQLDIALDDFDDVPTTAVSGQEAARAGIGFGVEGMDAAYAADIESGQTCGDSDWCAAFDAEAGRVPLHLQPLNMSDPSGEQGACSSACYSTGPLPPLLTAGLEVHAQIFEMHVQDLLLAFDPSYSGYGEYGSEYAAAISSLAAVVGTAGGVTPVGG